MMITYIKHPTTRIAGTGTYNHIPDASQGVYHEGNVDYDRNQFDGQNVYV